MPESITATSTRLPVASLCASGRLSRSGAYWSEFICGSCSCASVNRKFACAPATWVSPEMLRIISETLVPLSMRQRNSRRPVRRKVCVSMRVIPWRPEIALSCASDTLVGTSRITSFGTNGAPGGGRLKPLRRAAVVPFGELLPALGAPAPPPGGGKLTGWSGGGSADGRSGGSPRSGSGNRRHAMKAPSAAAATPPTTYQMVLSFESRPGCVGLFVGGHAVSDGHGPCADAACTPSVDASTTARNVRKIVRVIN